MKAILSVSGGMDSVTMLWWYHKLGYEIEAFSINYGQRHKKEIEMARWQCEHLGIRHSILDLSYIGSFLKGSALSDPSVQVPYGHYEQENMKVTVVPNRNSIMLNILYGIAIAEKADIVGTAVHAGDHAIYPDCRREFFDELNTTLKTGNAGLYDYPLPYIETPFITKTKAEILTLGLEMGVPYEKTLTCYEGQEIACGKCGTCVERAEAFAENHTIDPLLYRDTEYWREVTKIKEYQK